MNGEVVLRKARHSLEQSGGGKLQAQASRHTSVLARWGKFNLVGAIGIGVQFGALFFLKSAFHLHYLVATGIAVEIAVLHNFLWHERFTWRDRTRPKENDQHRSTLRLGSFEFSPGFFRSLLRFHFANGAVSILGNLAIMKALAGLEHMNYLIANLIAIAVCSLANFVLSDQWVFES
jgi:putative flippase GtrA